MSHLVAIFQTTRCGILLVYLSFIGFNFLQINELSLANRLSGSDLFTLLFFLSTFAKAMKVLLMCKIILYLLLFLSLGPLNLYGQKSNYRLFENIGLDAESSSFSCFFQDSQGLLWVGSDKGLFSYDKYSFQQFFAIGDRTNVQIHCGTMVGDTCLYLGTQNGLLIYNYKKDRYEEPTTSFPTDIRALALQGQVLWIGTLHGLYTYELPTQRLKKSSLLKHRNIPHMAVYSIICTTEGSIYIGTYNGLFRYLPKKNSFENITLPVYKRKSNQFVNCLLEDSTRHCIWIGMEGNLFQYDRKSGRVETIKELQNNSVKSLALDSYQCLLVGTDNGLYVYHESYPIQHILHDSRNSQSLSNNVIWTIFIDKDKNSWMGTDYGISLLRYNHTSQYVPIHQITETGDGNIFLAFHKDSRQNFWLGGSDGVIRFTEAIGTNPTSIWYRVGSARYPLVHSKTRCIYEDKENNIWIATDGSINRYDFERQQFVNYEIVDETYTDNANWAYDLFEDNEGRLWIATWMGGIFVVDKLKLMQSQGAYVADWHYTSGSGLSGMSCSKIVSDHNGCVWALLDNSYLNKINPKTSEVIQIPTKSVKSVINHLLCDADGWVWAGFTGGVMRITPHNNNQEIRSFNSFEECKVLSMIEVEHSIWLSTTNGVYEVDRQTMNVHRLNITNNRYSSMFFDSVTRQIYLGGVDGFVITSPELSRLEQTPHSIILTALYVNNRLYTTGSVNGQSIRYANQIQLDYRQNSLTFHVSDLSYSAEEKSEFIYKLNGLDQEWNLLGSNTNQITYSSLDYGTYQLLVCKVGADGRSTTQPYMLQIQIASPWYYTSWAKFLYLLITTSLCVWTFYFFRVRSRLKAERIEKKKILKQSKQKIDFFTNLSHDLKTPLSLIIAPLSKLVFETKNQQEKKLLLLMQSNAMKLNALIHGVLDISRVDSESSSCLILSKVEFVSFVRSQLSTFQALVDEKRQVLHFRSNWAESFLTIDLIKFESIFSNLLSNASKYTSECGAITVDLNFKGEARLLEISISDTGVGIPAKDLPFVFQRFFQSSEIQHRKDGTGIGLYLVKTYTELHGGNLQITSEVNVGTTICITLPLVVCEPPLAEADTESSDGKPLILIVDDDYEMAAFICQILQPKYRCQIANNGKAGVAFCLESRPDLIITDLVMPELDGLEMCRVIKKQIPTSTIPIILLTAKNDRLTELESIQMNIDVFIPKPFEPDMLIHRIEQLLNRKQSQEMENRLKILTTPKAIEAVSYDEKFLASVTQLIEDHISDSDLSVNKLSELSGIHAKQIYRKIKQLTGMSSVEYIKSIRMKKASMLLSQHKFSIAEVMYMVGFSTHSYFSKCFQASFGKTPREFIEST